MHCIDLYQKAPLSGRFLLCARTHTLWQHTEIALQRSVEIQRNYCFLASEALYSLNMAVPSYCLYINPSISRGVHRGGAGRFVVACSLAGILVSNLYGGRNHLIVIYFICSISRGKCAELCWLANKLAAASKQCIVTVRSASSMSTVQRQHPQVDW